MTTGTTKGAEVGFPHLALQVGVSPAGGFERKKDDGFSNRSVREIAKYIWILPKFKHVAPKLKYVTKILIFGLCNLPALQIAMLADCTISKDELSPAGSRI